MTRFARLSLLAAVLASSLAAAGGDPEAGASKAVLCAGCHGLDGNGVNALWPKLAGQHEAYLAKQLRDFRDGRRSNPAMAPFLPMLSEADIDNVAAYFAAQTPK